MSRVLFLTSNGAGLGHVTRCMAIARRMPNGVKPIFFTLSKALPPVRQQGFYVEHFPSLKASGLDSGQWHARFAAQLSAVVEEYRPAVIAFDGTSPYRGLRSLIKQQPGPAFVWIRRPMWQPDVEPHALTFSGLFDRIIEPGEFASPADEGPTVSRREEAICVDPITFCDESELLPRPEAEAQLGLEPGRVHALIQLGEVKAFERDFLMQASVTQILRDSETQIAILESAISERFVVPPTVRKIAATYPIARLYSAFDFVISAAGYNSYHELVGFQIPTAFYPVRKVTDNQAARARYAEDVGVGVETGLEPAAAIERLLSEAHRGRMKAKALELKFANGAVRAADEIARLARDRGTNPTASRLARRREQASGPQGSAAGHLVRLGAATEEDLRQIAGIGPVTARRIIEFRDQRGPISSVQQLENVTGVGREMLEVLSARVRP